MGGAAREGALPYCHRKPETTYTDTTLMNAGGKAKPLKAPKKEKKEMDEDDLAHKAKLKAGTENPIHCILRYDLDQDRMSG